jgi:hypothetical protein
VPPIRDPPWFPHQGSHGHQASSQAFGVTKFGMGKPHQKHRGQRQQCLRFLEKKTSKCLEKFGVSGWFTSCFFWRGFYVSSLETNVGKCLIQTAFKLGYSIQTWDLARWVRVTKGMQTNWKFQFFLGSPEIFWSGLHTLPVIIARAGKGAKTVRSNTHMPQELIYTLKWSRYTYIYI